VEVVFLDELSLAKTILSMSVMFFFATEYLYMQTSSWVSIGVPDEPMISQRKFLEIITVVCLWTRCVSYIIVAEVNKQQSLLPGYCNILRCLGHCLKKTGTEEVAWDLIWCLMVLSLIATYSTYTFVFSVSSRAASTEVALFCLSEYLINLIITKR